MLGFAKDFSVPQTIQHIVVLMLENRSFDHMIGFMRSTDYPINGLTGNEWNPRDPAHIEPGQEVRVSNDAGFIFSYDPGHSFHDVNLQLFQSGRASRHISAKRRIYPQLLTATARHAADCRHNHEVHGADYGSSIDDLSARIRSLRCLVLLSARTDLAEPLLCPRGNFKGLSR
jgi:Phosphoesterase family